MSATRRDRAARVRAGEEYDDHYEYDDYDEEYDEPGDEPDRDRGREEQREEEREETERPAGRARRSGGDGLSAMEAGEAGLRHITAIVTKNVEGVTAVRPTEDGWTVEVELLDARHIPSSSDTLALYEVEVDGDGELRSYRRTAMYSRARGREAR